MTGSSAHSCSSPCPVPGPTASHGAVGPRSPKPHGEPSFVANDAIGRQNPQPERDRVTPRKDPTDVPPSRDVQGIPDPYCDTSSERRSYRWRRGSEGQSDLSVHTEASRIGEVLSVGGSKEVSALRALIIGGGIAGTATAMALERTGVEPTIFEAYAESAGLEAGAYLTIAVNGMDALRAIGAHQRVLEAGFPTRTIRFQSGTGKRLGDIPIGGTLPDGTVTHTIKRADLYAVLTDEVKRRGIALEHDKELVSARLIDGKVVARFAGGGEAAGDVLVGADSIHSRTRQLIDPSAPTPHYTGLGNVGGFARVDSVRLEPETFLMVWGKGAFFGATPSPDGEIWWFANPPSDRELSRAELASMSGETWKQRLMELFAVDKSPAVEIIKATEGRLVGTNQYDMPHVPTWRRAGMVIIGDAAHAAAPASGQGASMAIEDAVVLAKSFRESPNVPAALAIYEAVRRPRVERVVQYGARFSRAKAPGTLSRIIRDLMLPLVFKRAANPKSMQSMSWLFDYHISWDQPLHAATREGADHDER